MGTNVFYTQIEKIKFLVSGFLVSNRFDTQNKRLRTVTDYDVKVISRVEPQVVQGRGKIEFPITQSVI